MKKIIRILLLTALIISLAAPSIIVNAGKGNPAVNYATRETVAHFLGSNYTFEPVRELEDISDLESCQYKDDVIELYRAGIFQLILEGDGSLTFRPDQYMTQGQFAVITVRVAEALGIDINKFDTLPSNLYGTFPEWYMSIVTNMGIYKTGKNGYINPDEYLTEKILTQKFINILDKQR